MKMKIDNQLTKKELNRKRQVMTPLNFGTTFVGIFTRRKKTKSGLKRYYLYTSDKNKLVIASEFHFFGDSYHRISLSSTNFIPSDDHCVGQLYLKEYSASFLGKINHFTDSTKQEDSIRIRYSREYEKVDDTLPREVEVTILPHADTDADDDYTIKQAPFSLFPELYPDINYKDSKKNLLLLVKKDHCFSLAKEYKDEFFFAVSYPLSIFQGFCIAASLFQKLKNE